MKNEMPEPISRLWIEPNPTAWGALCFHTSPEIKSGVEFVRADLTDRRTDVDALIRLAERVFYEHGETVNMNSNDDLADKLWEAIQAIRDARE